MTAEQEAARLEVLKEYGLLDTDAEPEFDELVQLATAICQTPMGSMTLIDEQRQWFKAAVGMASREGPRDIAFCSHAIEGAELFVVEDAAEDDRFAANPLVTGAPGIRFYAGMPLEAPQGARLGTLCVIDTVPRKLTEAQREALQVLSKQVTAQMELRHRQRALARALTEKERIAGELQASEQMFRTFMDNSPFVSYMKGPDGRYLYYSRKFREIFQVSGDEWVGTHDRDHFPENIAGIYQANDAAVLRSGKSAIVSETAHAEDGSLRFWQSHKFPCRDAEGRLLLGGISVDVTEDWRREIELQASKLELEERNAQLSLLSRTDGLTGMRNRRAFEERLSNEFAMARRKGRPLTLVMLDIDRFKDVNDRLGHAAGDDVLCEVAEVLKENMRQTDLATRYGGEEFGVILQETDTPHALAWASRLEAVLAGNRWKHGAVTLSMGIAELGPEVNDPAHLVKLADDAMYAAKRRGRARAVVYGADVAEEMSAKMGRETV